MARSGVQAGDECIKAFNDLKLSRKHKYIIYEINKDRTQIDVVQSAEPSSATSNENAFAEFAKLLPTEECRYAVFDFEYEKSDGSGKRNRICFFTWIPDTAPIRQKMLYSTSQDALRKSLVGVQIDVQANGPEDIDFNEVLTKAEKLR